MKWNGLMIEKWDECECSGMKNKIKFWKMALVSGKMERNGKNKGKWFNVGYVMEMN